MLIIRFILNYLFNLKEKTKKGVKVFLFQAWWIYTMFILYKADIYRAGQARARARAHRLTHL